MLTAALDAARLGARAPLSADLLRAAAPGYCTSQQQAEAPDNWFEQALAYATGKLHGAAAALSPAGAGMGQVAGYTVADYLLQHASRERRYARVPASTWDAILSHIRDPADAARLADSASSRLLYRYAIPLYRHAADAGDGTAAGSWPGCWPSAATWTGCAPGPTPATRTPPSSWPAAGRARGPGRAARPGRRRRPACRRQLAELLAERGDLDGAARPGRRRRRVRRPAAGRPAGRARRPGRAELRARADAGDGYAARRLAELLAERGDLDGLRARADAGDGHAAGQLAELLAERGDLDRAARPGRRRRPGTPPCGWPSCWPSAATWTGCAPGPTPATGMPPRGWPSCWPSAATWTSCAPGPTPATKPPPAAGRAAGRARRPGRAARPGRRRRRAAAVRLAELLAERGDLDGLRARADAGDRDCRRAAGRPAGRAR